MKCQRRRKNGDPCGAQAVAGTEACVTHAGVPKDQHKAKGQVVVELSRWGITDQTLDPGETLLKLMTQSFNRAAFYSMLLEQAYEAAERLRGAGSVVDAMDEVEGAGPSGLPGVDSQADRDRATQDLQRIFSTGGVAALIGHTYASSEGGVFAAGEAIRGLVQLEAQERDRAASMAAKAVAAGLAKRQVELAEQTAAQFATAMKAVLAALGHDVASPEVLRVVSTQLRALEVA